MKKSWIRFLASLNERSRELKEELLRSQMGPARSQDAVETASSLPFYTDTTHHGKFVRTTRFDCKKYFELSGNISIYHFRPLWHGLLYYDTIFLPLYPCDEQFFRDVHGFAPCDYDRIIDLCKRKRIVLYLTSDPLDYVPCTYQERILREVQPLLYPFAPVTAIKPSDADADYEKLTDDVTEIPDIKRALQRHAREGRESFKTTEHAFISALQLLYYWEMEEFRELVWKILFSDPYAAIDVAFAVRRLLLNPMDFVPEFPQAVPLEATLEDYWKVGRNVSLPGKSFPGEIGAMLQSKLSYPAPLTWDGLQWCMDHLDVPAVRTSFSIIDSELRSSVARSGDELHELSGHIEACWNSHIREANRVRQLVYWGSTLSVGAVGSLVTEPLVGFLAALGLTTTSNLLLGPFSQYATSKIIRKSFHIWQSVNLRGRPA